MTVLNVYFFQQYVSFQEPILMTNYRISVKVVLNPVHVVRDLRMDRRIASDRASIAPRDQTNQQWIRVADEQRSTYVALARALATCTLNELSNVLY